MNLWRALRRLMPLLAVLSLVMTPAAAPAATALLHASMRQAHPAAAEDGQVRTGMDHVHAGHQAARHAGHHGAASAMPGMDQAGVDEAGMDGAGMDGAGMDDMPCCPKTGDAEPGAQMPDCGKGCPLMALCLAGAAPLLLAAIAVPTPNATRASPSWPAVASLASVPATPLPEPPRA